MMNWKDIVTRAVRTFLQALCATGATYLAALAVADKTFSIKDPALWAVVLSSLAATFSVGTNVVAQKRAK